MHVNVMVYLFNFCNQGLGYRHMVLQYPSPSHIIVVHFFFFGITKCVVEKGVGAPRNVSCMDPTKVCGEQGS